MVAADRDRKRAVFGLQQFCLDASVERDARRQHGDDRDYDGDLSLIEVR